MANKCSAVDDGQWSKMSGGTAPADGGFMLFGVRLMEGSFRKSASMNNLALYDQTQESNNDAIAAGYASDDVVHPSGRSRERKRGVPWSEEEHKLFLLGLKQVGKGDWRGISRNFVKTRTPTQVASHAQKYFLRQNNHGRRRRRSSLFDITTDAVFRSSAMEEQMNKGNSPQSPIIQPKNLSKNPHKFPIPITSEKKSMENLNLGQVNQLNNSPKPIRPIPILPLPPTSKMANLDLNKTNTITTTASTEYPSLSLNLSISSQSLQPPPSAQQPPPARHASTFHALSAGFSTGGGGDSIISVA